MGKTRLRLYMAWVRCYGTSLGRLVSQFFFRRGTFVHKPANKKVPVVSVRGNGVPCSPH